MRKTKLISLFAAVLLAANAVAQDVDKSVMFCDKDGNIIEDGATIIPTRTSVQELMPGYTLINVYSDLNVKNLAAQDKYIAVEMAVDQIDNGAVQICCYGNCFALTAKGMTKSNPGTVTSGELVDLQTEWAPDFSAPDGVCKVTYQVLYYDLVGNQYTPNADHFYGPKVNVVYAYGTDITAIKDMSISALDVVKTEYFDLQGHALNAPAMGINIKKATYANGQTKTYKVIIQ